MKFEIAVALNWKKYLDQLTANKSTYRLFSTYTACKIREVFTRYINNIGAPLKKDMSSLYMMLLPMKDLPYPIDKPDVVSNNQAVQCGQKLMLFHWFDTISEKHEWNVKSKNLQNYRKVVYEFRDGKRVYFEMCDLTYDNLSYLKVINWTVYASFKRIQELPDVKKSGLDSRLFPYQVEGVRMLSAGFRLLADDQGLGKTAQVLQYIKIKGIKKILICCPATLKLNWQKETLMWTDFTKEDISIIQGAQPYDVDNKVTIINYDLLPYWAEKLKHNKYQLVVADECHYVQSEKAQRTKAFLTVIENSEDRIFISGTPFTSRPYQMYTALHNIAPKIFRSAQEYGLKFCGPTYQMNKLVFKGASNMDVLHSILMDGICIRRLKEDVLQELPEKMRVTLPMGMNAAEIRKDPDLFHEICRLEGKIARATDLLGTMEWRKQIAYLRKQKDILTWIRDFLETGKKLVVFGVHRMALDAVEEAFPGISVRVDGTTPNKTRDAYVERFQKDPECRLFIGNVQAAGVGLTLTAASDLLMIEFPWTFSAVVQAEDRIHRIGAKNACTIYYMTCPDTIDERLVDIINNKAKIHKKIFDGKNEDNLIANLKGYEYVPLFPEENVIDLKKSKESEE